MATNRLIIETINGRVGIGTTNPQYRLDVSGNTQFNGNNTTLFIRNGNSETSTIGFTQPAVTGYGAYIRAGLGLGDRYISFGISASGTNNDATELFRIDDSGTVGVGVTNPYSRLTITAASVSWGEGITINPAPNGYSAVYFRTEAATNDSYTNSWAVGKNASGQTGGELLHVVREQLTGSALHRVDAVQSWQTSGNSCFGFNVGIGNTNPNYKLHIGNNSNTASPHILLDGTFANTAVSSHSRIYFGDTNFGIGAGGWAESGNEDDLYIWAFNGTGRDIRFCSTADGSTSVTSGNWTTNMIIKNNGLIGIGITNPGTSLHVKGNGTSNTYRGVIRVDNTDGQQWAGVSFPDDASGSDVASNNYYFIGRGQSIASRVFSIHMPNAGDYGSGAQPKFGIFSTGADTLFTVESSTGNSFIKGGLNIDGTIGFRRASGDYGTYIRSNGYPAQGYANADGTKYWVELGAAGGVHVVLNTDGGAGQGENSYDHFTIWQGSNSGDKLFHVTNVGNVVAKGNITNQSWKGHTFIPLTSVVTKTFTFTGNSSGSFPTTDFSGVPSNAKALLVYGWYHITGYGSGAGQGDHAVSWFGYTNQASVYSWSGPGAAWPGGGSFVSEYYGSFVMEHDGDASGTGLTNWMHYYGSWHNGIICPNADGNIRYNLGFGLSGGTHYNALYCVGYWI